MAKLPSPLDLGGLARAEPGMPVATYDVSPIARGGQAMAQGAIALGKGVSELGEGVGSYALDRNRWDYAKAHSDFLAKKIDLDAATAQDRNYAADDDGKTLPDRYQANITKLRDDAAGLIRDPRMRERFVQTITPDVERGVVSAKSHARGLENDASIAYVQQQGDNLANKAIATQDDATRTQLIDSHNQLVDGLVAQGAIDQVKAVAMKQTWAHQFATADLLHLAETDPQAALNHLQAAPGSGDQVTSRILQIEGTSKNARSSATGAGQFIDSTWLDMLKRHRPDLAQGRGDQDLLALRADRQLGREMTEAYRGENETFLKRQGIAPTPGAQYLAHFLGPGTAAAVLKADPNQPISEALTAAVGDKKAAEFIAANPEVLQGRLVGSVTQWADAKMGGQHPGGAGSIYDNLRPDVREQLIARATAQLNRETTNNISTFHNAVQDDVAEANHTGFVTKPKTIADFVGAFGAAHGPQQFAQYQATLQTAADKRTLSTMPPAQIDELLQSYEPKPGPGYAEAVKRLDDITKAARGVGVARLKASLDADLAEANRTGQVSVPKTLPDFELAYGKDNGADAFQAYERALKTASDARALPSATAGQARGLIRSYEPQPGPGYDEGLKRQGVLIKAATELAADREKDPAGYGIKYLPSVSEAWQGLSGALSDATASPQARAAMARDYATKQIMEQQRFGIDPEDVRIVPQAYIDNIDGALKTAAAADDPKARVGVVAQIQREKALWGEHWPAVFRQLAPTAQPMVRAIAAGADERAMIQLLGVPKEETAKKIVGEQNETKFRDLTTKLNESMAPFKASLVGAQRGGYFDGYYGITEKLAALHIRDGEDAEAATARAFKEVIGGRYEFRDTWRMPTDARVDANVVQLGTSIARRQIAAGEMAIQPARDDIGLRDRNVADSRRDFSRNGRFVTAWDESGLQLVASDGNFVRGPDQKPLVLTWAKLVELGKDRNAFVEPDMGYSGP